MTVFTSATSTLSADIIDDLDSLSDGPLRPAPPPQEPSTSAKTPADNADKDQTPSSSVQAPINPAPAAKTTPASKKTNDDQRRKLPIHLKSDGNLTYSKGGQIAHLIDNVRISQGNLRFRSDEAKAYFVDLGGETITDKVEIFGDVNVAKTELNPAESIKASGDRALFLNRQSKITLMGNAKLWQGGHLIRGQQITYDLATGIIRVDRAEGVLQPEDKPK